MSFDAQPLDDVLVGAPDPEIVELEGRLRAAQLAADVAALDALIAEDLLFVGPDGRLATKSQDLEAHATGVVRFREHVPEELRVRRVGGGRRRDEPAGAARGRGSGRAQSRHVSLHPRVGPR